MTKTFDQVVGNFKDPNPVWQVEVNGTEYSRNLELLEFKDSINNPIEFTVKLSGIDGNVSFPKDSEVIIKKAGAEVFRGVLQQVNPDILQTFTLKGAGYASELESNSAEIVSNTGGVSNPFQSTDVQTVVDTLVDQHTTNTNQSRTFSTSYSGGADTKTVNDFRVEKEQLKEVNRFMGEYSAEWYVTYDGSNNPVLNVADQIQFDNNGNALDTLTVYGSDQTAEVVNQNVNRNKGDFDGVVVRGYGDGDDQVSATAGSTGQGNRVLIYTDKTILTDSQAQTRADELNSTRTVDWQEIDVKTNDPNKLYGIGDLLTVDAKDAKLNDDYRVVETHYKIWPGEDQFESKLMLSNKPQTFLSDFETEKEKRESQTDFSQGNRNTINESNEDLADSNNATKLEFNVPQRFVQDQTGKDRTAQIRLDYVVDNYKKAFSATDTSVTDSSSKFVKTTVDDFGDVDIQRTQKRSLGETSSTVADFTETDVTEAGGSSRIDYGDSLLSENNSIDSFSTFTTVQTFTSAQSSQAISVIVSGYNEGLTGGIESASHRMWVRVKSGFSNAQYPAPSGHPVPLHEAGNSDERVQMGPVTINIPENIADSGDVDYEVQCAMGNNSEAGWDIETTYSIFDQHTHSLPDTDEGADNVAAYTAKSNGVFINASENASQSTESVADANTVTVGELDNTDVVLSEQTTNATSLTVKVNGTEVSGSPFSLSSGPPYTNEDIDITSEATTPGFNTLELIPDSNALVKGNVTVDHKVDGERT